MCIKCANFQGLDCLLGIFKYSVQPVGRKSFKPFTTWATDPGLARRFKLQIRCRQELYTFLEANIILESFATLLRHSFFPQQIVLSPQLCMYLYLIYFSSSPIASLSSSSFAQTARMGPEED
jgi:hypothetical protein